MSGIHYKQNKWSHKALKGVFLGYTITQKGYKVYHPITKKYMVSKDVVLDEKTFFFFLRERKKGPQAWDPPDVIATMTIATKSKFKGVQNSRDQRRLVSMK